MQEPQEALLPEAVQHVAAGDAHTLCLTASGDVWASGSDSHGQLGLGGEASSVRRLHLVKALEGTHSLAREPRSQSHQPGNQGCSAQALLLCTCQAAACDTEEQPTV